MLQLKQHLVVFKELEEESGNSGCDADEEVDDY